MAMLNYKIYIRRTCGNSIVEEGEDCDCGTIEECQKLDPCCDPFTCKLTNEAECASGPCCNNCRLRQKGIVCREQTNECDLPEVCDGLNGQCPSDVYKKNGNPCSSHGGYCFNGYCPTLNLQCEQIWGYGGLVADKECFEQFNAQGSLNGNCGKDPTGRYIKCEAENVRCGSLQCKLGNRYPIVAGMDQLYSRTIVSIEGKEFECKVTSGTIDSSEIPDMGLVRDGSPCGENLICVNQSCVSIFPHIDQGKCPSNQNNLECSGNGVCTNMNQCYCSSGWNGPDCSIQVEVTNPPTFIPSVTTTTPLPGAQAGTKDHGSKMEKKETPYGDNRNNNLSTLSMVFILVGVVKGVFICFALMAVCYRYSAADILMIYFLFYHSFLFVIFIFNYVISLPKNNTLIPTSNKIDYLPSNKKYDLFFCIFLLA
ncbi:hypothetical protein B566_EDAN002711 [Ephemera danica]|nr:hypothetical protein B566_EDAN002711 [Ephemera danica]